MSSRIEVRQLELAAALDAIRPRELPCHSDDLVEVGLVPGHPLLPVRITFAARISKTYGAHKKTILGQRGCRHYHRPVPGRTHGRHSMKDVRMVSKLPASPVWLITGCSAGFGRALAERVLAHGHRCVVTARNVSQVEAIVGAVSRTALALALDVTDAAARERAVRAARRSLRPHRRARQQRRLGLQQLRSRKARKTSCARCSTPTSSASRR